MVDKPGMISLEQLAEVRKVQKETGSDLSRSAFPSASRRARPSKAGELVAGGRDRQASCTRSASARTRCATIRPAGWFFDRKRYGGILADIASHQCEQFLLLHRLDAREVTAATRRQPR